MYMWGTIQVMTIEELKAIRKELGISQTVLADFLGMARISITKMECGMRPISRVVEIGVRAFSCANCRAILPPAPARKK